jgi:hypothetical protein
VPFGRLATDPERLDRIGRRRREPVGRLLDGVASGLGSAAEFLRRLTPGQLERTGLHPTRGELTVAASLDRFVATHLEEHVEQLRSILVARPTG